MASEKKAEPRKYKLVGVPQGGYLEIGTLKFKVTNENVNNPNVISAITKAERRLNTQIMGVQIVLE